MNNTLHIHDLARIGAAIDLRAIHETFPDLIAETFTLKELQKIWEQRAAKVEADTDDMQPEYDFSHGVRGKHTKRAHRRTLITRRSKRANMRPETPTKQWLLTTLQRAKGPMRFGDIVSDVMNRGWKSASNNPRAVLSVTLRKDLIAPGIVRSIKGSSPAGYSYVLAEQT